MPTEDRPARTSVFLREIFILVCLCGFLFFYGLGNFGLIGADEPRYAQVAREMLAAHDWVTPTLGGQPWLEKPPIYYWQAMVSYTIFGISDWAARTPSAVDATLLVLAVFLFLRRFGRNFALDGALITASSAAIIGFSRAASTDMPLAAMFGIAMLAWYAWQESESKPYLFCFYAFLALGTLAKGPVAPFLAGLIIATFALAKGDLALIKKSLSIPGVLVFFVVALPWFVAVQIRNPEFFRIFILEHNLARFGTNLYHHKEPFWYYLPVALLCAVPWTVFVIVALTQTLRIWFMEKRAGFQSEDWRSIFFAIWFVIPILFFSVSQSKLPGYILPALPAAGLMVCEYVRRTISSGEQFRGGPLLALHAVLSALLLVPALMIQYIIQQHRLPWNKAAVNSFALSAVIAIAIVLILRGRLGLRALRITLLPVVLAVAIVLRIGSTSLDDALSARPLDHELGHRATVIAVLQVPREVEYGLAFYRNAVIHRYESGDVPGGEHLLVVPAGSSDQIKDYLHGRRILQLGNISAQNLDYFWVAAQ